jgi:hypothetical protein
VTTPFKDAIVCSERLSNANTLDTLMLRIEKGKTMKICMLAICLVIGCWPLVSVQATPAPTGTGGGQTKLTLDAVVFTEFKSGVEPVLEEKYVLCYQGSDVKNLWTPKADIYAGCAPLPVANQVAIKAGKRVAILVERNDTTCPTVHIDWVTQNVPSVDPYPVRGAAAPVQAKNVPPDGKSFAFDGGHAHLCYAVLPGALAADTLNTFTIQPSPVPAAASTLAKGMVTDIHTYYRFGVSTAVVLNNIRTNTYAYTAANTPASGTTPASIKYDTTTSVRTFDPVLFLTWYPIAVDTETKVKWTDPAHYDYGLVIGLSEKAPTTNFYLGLSVEPVRNIAIVVGASVISVARLTSGTFDPGPSAMHAAPSTTNVFKVGGFVGLSFNFSNFLSSTIFK